MTLSSLRTVFLWSAVWTLCAAADGRVVQQDCLQMFLAQLDRDNVDANASCPAEPALTRLHALKGKSEVLLMTIPDPETTGLAVLFDQAVDGVSRAAEKAGYTYYRHWLPWRTAKPSSRSQASTAKGEKTDQVEAAPRVRGSDPGIIIFQAPGRTAYLTVLLVGEAPSGGIDSPQFKNALKWRDLLVRSTSSRILLSGPMFSGSFDSLTALVAASKKKKFKVVTGTSTRKVAWTRFTKELTGNQVEFHSVVYSDEDAIAGLLKHLKPCMTRRDRASSKGAEAGAIDAADGDCGESVVFLTESGTSFGNLGTEVQRRTIHFRFPRGVAALRDATARYRDGLSESRESRSPLADLSRRLIPFSFGSSPGSSDLFPVYSAEHTPLEAQEAMESISSTIRTERPRFVVISATDILDEIYVTEFVRERSPNVRVIVLDADLLLIHAAESSPLTGVLSVSTYPLFTYNQYLTSGKPYIFRQERTVFPSQYEEGIYNSCILLIPPTMSNNDNRPHELLDYRWPDTSSPSQAHVPPLWLTVVGKDGYWPVTILNDPSESVDHLYEPRSEPRDSKATLRDILVPSRGWLLVFWLLTVTVPALAFAPFLTSHPSWRSRRSIFPAHYSVLHQIDGAMGRAACLLAVSLTSIAAYVLFTYPLWFSDQFTFPSTKEVPVWVAIGATFIALLGALLSYALNVVRATPTSRTEYVPGLLAILIFVAFLVAGHSTFGGLGSVYRQWFFLYRMTRLESGVSPMLPLLVIAAGLFSAATIHSRRLQFAALRRPPLPKVPFLNVQGASDFNQRIQNWMVGSWDWFLALAVPLATFYLIKLVRHPESLEGPTYDWIWGGFLTLLAYLEVSAFSRFLECWKGLKDFLDALENHALRFAFSRMPKEYSWLPIWQRGGMQRDYLLLHRLKEVLQSLERDGNPSKEMKILEDSLSSTLASKSLADSSTHWIHLRTSACLLVESTATELESVWRRGGSDSYRELRKTKPPEEATAEEKGELAANRNVIYAEEAVALPFVAYIRYAFVQLRNLLMFVVLGFAAILLSFNAYPFRSQSTLTGVMVIMFVVIALGVSFVFAQMDRDPILSRLKNREAGLGWGFVHRLATYGALPLLTMLTTYSPELQATVASLLEPVMRILKND